MTHITGTHPNVDNMTGKSCPTAIWNGVPTDEQRAASGYTSHQWTAGSTVSPEAHGWSTDEGCGPAPKGAVGWAAALVVSALLLAAAIALGIYVQVQSAPDVLARFTR
jgi:hypothetical protein